MRARRTMQRANRWGRSVVAWGLVACALCCLAAAPSGVDQSQGWRAGAALGSNPPLRVIAAALDRAGAGTLPAGYPALMGGVRIPAVVLKAVAWVESGWRQFRTPNVPLLTPDWGSGVLQVTRGMGGEPVADPIQTAIRNNFVYNIASGARILSQKWLATPPVGARDPRVVEDWYYALWAYNGWGWVNNPANPRFTRQGTPAADPAAFPYQERVFYWLRHPPLDAAGQPLWPPVDVTLPAASSFAPSVAPAALPGPARGRFDPPQQDPPLVLPTVDAGAVVADLTSAETQPLTPGRPFHKEWLLRNTGGRFWSGYTWRFVGGSTAPISSSIVLPYAPPLADIPVGIDIQVPSRSGVYEETWGLYAPGGKSAMATTTVRITVDGHGAGGAIGAPTPGNIITGRARGWAPAAIAAP